MLMMVLIDQKTAWDEPVVPENLPPPPDIYKQQYQQYTAEMKKSYQQKCAGPVSEVCWVMVVHFSIKALTYTLVCILLLSLLLCYSIFRD